MRNNMLAKYFSGKESRSFDSGLIRYVPKHKVSQSDNANSEKTGSPISLLCQAILNKNKWECH